MTKINRKLHTLIASNTIFNIFLLDFKVIIYLLYRSMGSILVYYKEDYN